MLAWVGALASAADLDTAHLLDLYEAVRVPLAQDQVEGARSAARSLSTDVPPEVAAAAVQVAAAGDPKAARVAFGELSRAVVHVLATTGPPDGTKVFRCPMAEGWPFWLQQSSGMANPYMGLAMPTCGEGTSFRAAVKAAKP
jgi:hypothetical protein